MMIWMIFLGLNSIDFQNPGEIQGIMNIMSNYLELEKWLGFNMIQLAIFEGLLGFPLWGVKRPSRMAFVEGRERVHIFDEDSQTVAFNSAALFFNLRFFVEAAKLNEPGQWKHQGRGKYLV